VVGVQLVQLPQVTQHQIALHGGQLATIVELKTFVEGVDTADQTIGGGRRHMLADVLNPW
jgi:hypothetical protein